MRRLLVVLLLVTGCSTTHTDGPPRAVPPSTTPAGVRVVRVGGSPCGIAEAAGAVYVSDAASARLLRIDPASLAVTVVTTLDLTPCELTFAFGALWVTTQSGLLDRVDLITKAVRHIPVGAMSYEAEPAAGALWVSDRNSAQLTRVDPVSLRTTTLALPGTHPGGLVSAFDSLWVGDDTPGATHVLRVDPVRRTVLRVPAGARPAYVTATSKRVWVSNVGAGTVTVLDPATLKGRDIKVGTSPVNLDALGDEVWVPDDVGNAVYRLSSAGAVLRRYDAGAGGPAVVAPVGKGVWATLFASGQVWAISPT